MAEKYELTDHLVSKFIDLFCYDTEAEEYVTKGNKVRSAEHQKVILDLFGEISDDDEKQKGPMTTETSPPNGKAVRKVVRKLRAKKVRVVQDTGKGLKRKLDSQACVDFKSVGPAKKQKSSCVSVEQRKSVEIDANLKPSSFASSWPLIEIDIDDQHRPSPRVICLSGKSYSDFFFVSKFEAEDFELEWQAIENRDVKSRMSEYRPCRS